ncbi:MAG TPA: hypothetical protein VNN07_02590 [Candidatus Tectomicrobia bacterium]|nr:hypothetical protein [Candidatus Tectomicrobia bacterium]
MALTPAVIGRLLGLAALLWLGGAVLVRGLAPPAGGILGFLHLVDLVFHEAGHVIFGVLGEFAGVLGGSLNQVLIPAVCAGSFLWRGQRAAGAVCLGWTGESLADVAVYAADGRAMRLPLLAEGLVHDWNYLLSALALREHAEAVGRAILLAGVLTILGAIVLMTLDLAARAYPRDAAPDAR